jgi:hypothetical protein
VNVLAGALPEFLGSVAATLLIALTRWTAGIFRSRTGRPARSRCDHDDPDRENGMTPPDQGSLQPEGFSDT